MPMPRDRVCFYYDDLPEAYGHKPHGAGTVVRVFEDIKFLVKMDLLPNPKDVLLPQAYVRCYVDQHGYFAAKKNR